MKEDFIIENGILTRYNGESHVIDIPEGVTKIDKDVFKGMSWITDVTLPEGLNEIGENAFKGCRQLQSINFPETLVKIGDFAFHRCHSLTSVILPDSVTHIGKCAFLYCDKMTVFHANGVKKLDKQTFANDTELREISLNCEIDHSNFKDDIFTGCVKIEEIRLSDGFSYHVDDLVSEINSESSISPVVYSIAKGVYNSLVIENGVLFRLCVNLKNFELPHGIKCIEKSCFFDKKGIVSIDFPETLEKIRTNAFGNCINLEQISFKNESVTVDDGAFKGCSNLKRVIIGEREYVLSGINYDSTVPFIIRKINEQILSDFYISGKVLMSYAGREERVTVPDGIETIAEGCFMGNMKLDRIIMSDSVKEIHENAFKNCTSLQSAVLSDNIDCIRRGAFENCRKLIRFNVPSALKTTGEYAFRGCVSLEVQGFETGVPDAVKPPERQFAENDIEAYRYCGDDTVRELVIQKKCIIGKYAFSSCKNLRSVKIDSEDVIIEKYAFAKCPSLTSVSINASTIEKGAFSFCRKLSSVSINGVHELEDEVFAGCTSLSEITYSDDLKIIGKRCFDECISLKNISFENIEKIDERAFERCDGLTYINLSRVLAEYHAFADCSGLKTIELDPHTVLKSGALFSCTNADSIIFDGNKYSISLFSQSMNRVENDLPLKVEEAVGSIYSCFSVSSKNEIIKYSGDSVRVRIPDDIESVGDEAFRDHLRTEEIIFPESVKYIGKLTFSGTGWIERKRCENVYNIVNHMIVDAAHCPEKAVIGAETDRICSWAFAGNTELKELILEKERIIVDCFAFRNCINLKSIKTSDGKVHTLSCLNDLNTVDYPPLVRQIFSETVNCFKTSPEGILEESTGNIKNLVFPDGINSIADEVYKDCNLLESIVFSKDTEKIGNRAFENSRWLKCVKNAGSVKFIGSQAFSGCVSLETVDISDEVCEIGKRCFEHCSNLTEIHISNKLEEIPERAFFRCKSLKKVIVPASVKTIGSQAFAFCDELESVVFESDDVKISDDAFAWCDKL